MSSTVLSQVEKTIISLPLHEQLWLIERLVHHLREDSTKSHAIEQDAFESQLAVMVKDPEIQAELREIDREFAVTEADGLEN
jgi:hypothetical protein